MRSTVAGSSMTSGSLCSVRVRRARLAATAFGFWTASWSWGGEAEERAWALQQEVPGDEDTTQPPGPGVSVSAGRSAGVVHHLRGTGPVLEGSSMEQ